MTNAAQQENTPNFLAFVQSKGLATFESAGGASWLLDKVEQTRRLHGGKVWSGPVLSMDPEWVKRLLENGTRHTRRLALEAIPPEAFSASMGILEKIWKSDEPVSPEHLKRMVPHAKDKVVELVQSWMTDENARGDLSRAEAAIEALIEIGPAGGKEVTHRLISWIRELGGEEGEAPLQLMCLHLALMHGIQDEMRGDIAILWESEPATRAGFFERLTSESPLLDFVQDRQAGVTESAFKDHEWLFQPGAPLAQIDREARPKDRFPVKQALHLLSRAPRDKAPAPYAGLAALLLAEESRIRREGEECTDIVLALVALIYQVTEVTPPATLEEAMERAKSSIAIMPGYEGVRAQFEKAEPARRTALIQELLAPGLDAGLFPHHGVRLAADFPDASLVPSLLKLIPRIVLMADEDNLVAALARTGAEAEGVALDYFNNPESVGAFVLAPMLGWVGGDKTRTALEKDLATLRKKELSRWCGAASWFPGEWVLERIAAELPRRIPECDGIYHELSSILRTGQTEADKLTDAHDRIEQRRLQLEGIFPENRGGRDSLDLELRCRVCDTPAWYVTENIRYDVLLTRREPSLPKGLKCVGCNVSEQLELTAQARYLVMSEIDSGLERLRNGEEPGKAIRYEGVEPHGADPDRFVEDELRRRIERDPKDPAPLIRLGEHMREKERKEEALTYFARARQLDPHAVEAFIPEIEMAVGRGDLHRAHDLLHEIAKDTVNWKLYVADSSELHDIEEYLEKLAELIHERVDHHGGHDGHHHEAPAQSQGPAAASTPKVTVQAGRNDPCPCGSGKKYKKCCLK